MAYKHDNGTLSLSGWYWTLSFIFVDLYMWVTIDQILCLDSHLVWNLEILSGESSQNLILIYCKLYINHPVDFTYADLTRAGILNSGTFWDLFTEEQIYFCIEVALMIFRLICGMLFHLVKWFKVTEFSIKRNF